MRKKFTFLTAAIALLVGLAFPMGMRGQTRDYAELYSADFTTVETHSYTQNKTFTLNGKSWTASVSQVNGGVFYLGCNSNNAAKGILNNNTTFAAVVTALRAADATYNTNYSAAHAYALLFDNAYNDVTKVEFNWAGGNNAFQVYLFGDNGSGYVQLGYTNYSSSGASVAGSVEWTGDATNYTKFAIVARPGTTNSTATNKTLRASTFTIYKTTSGGSQAAATTTTIDATGINNTDVYVGTAAGSLSATVTSGGNAISGATVTWSGDDDDVATINASTGAVTLVAAGTVTFTATYAGVSGEYQGSSDTYEMTVVDNTPYVQPTTIEITPNYTFWGKTAQFSGNTNSDLTGSQDNVSLHWTSGGSSNNMYASSTAMRFYGGNTLVFTAPSGYEIKSIVMTMNTTSLTDLAFSPSGYDSQTKTWTGAAATVTMSRPSAGTSYYQISKFTITIGLPSSVATPAFSLASGSYIGTQNVTISCETTGATIYYTTDGTTPSASNGTLGTSVTITETTTLKAIAIKDNEESAVATAEYTIELPLSTMDQIFAKASENNGAEKDVVILFDDWIVTGVGTNGKRAFVTDDTKGFIIYNSTENSLTFQKGQVLSGQKNCKVQLLNGAPCVTGLNASDFIITQTGVEPTVTSTTINALSAVNTGAVVDLGQLTWNGSCFVDGTASIYYYNTVYSATLVANKVYNVKGVYVYYNGNSSPHEIAPRDANDIVEVTVPALYNYSINGVEGEIFDAYVGETITLATGQNFNSDLVFVGWTTDESNVNEHLNGAYTITSETTTFYAVYANTSSESAFSFEITPSDFNKTSYTANDGNHISEATSTTGGTLNVTWTSSNVMLSNDGEIQFRKSPAGSISAANLGTITSVNVVETSSDALDVDFEGGSFTIGNNGTATGYATSITVTFTASSTNYYTRVYTKDINANTWYFIASPTGEAPINVDALGDLYYYDEPTHYWRNKKVADNADGFDFGYGKGYLCANENADVTLSFTGNIFAGNTLDVPVTYTAANGGLAGCNLVGNPFNCNAYIGQSYFVVGQENNEWKVLARSGAIAPFEGVMVKTAENVSSITFSKNQGKSEGNVTLALSRKEMTRGAASSSLVDNVIVSFDEGSQLEKLVFNNELSKLYIPQNGKDYAVVSAEAQGEMPVNFKASTDGEYTITVNPEGVELNYLHLIDNLTGMDVNLLQTPSYTFDATTRDYESRFRLVFAGASTSSATDETFAYYDGSEWQVSNEGEATLQVVDVMGRIVSTETVNGNFNLNLNQTAGVYMLRLINSNGVKTQKIVVR